MIVSKRFMVASASGGQTSVVANMAVSESISRSTTLSHGFLTRNPRLFTGLDFPQFDLRAPSSSVPDLENFQRCRSHRLLSSLTGIPVSKIVNSKHVHGTHIVRVGDFENEFDRPYTGFGEVDGLVTNERGVILLAKAADCATILVYDPVLNALGVAHSGKKGTELGMPKAIVSKMVEEFRSDPKNLLVWISPAAQKSSYVVFPRENKDFPDEFSESISAFENYSGFFLPQWRIDDIISGKETILVKVDVPSYIAYQLLAVGILLQNLEISPLDTITGDFASYRRDGENYANSALFAHLK